MVRISSFLEQYGKAQTKMGYTSAIFAFYDYIYKYQRKGKRASVEDREKYEEFAETYFTSSQDYVQDLINYAASRSDRPAKTVQMYVSAIREFMVFNGVNFTDAEKKRIKNKTPRGGAATVEDELDLEKIRVIMQHADLKLRTLILFLVSSGLRLNEALSLNKGDIDLQNKMGVVTIRPGNTKTRHGRITFCTPEAEQSLKEWLKVRDQYLESAKKRSNGINRTKNIDGDDRIFPFSDSNVVQMWENCLNKSGLANRDEGTNRLQLHPHMFRKFFSSQLRVVVPADIVEVLMGHRVGGVIGTYRSYTRQELQSHYEKGMHLLTVSMPKEIQEIENEFKSKLQGQETRLNGQGELLEKIIRENMEMKNKLDKLMEISIIQARLLNYIANQPGAADVYKELMDEWYNEIYEGKWGSEMRDRLVQSELSTKL
jgi:integrase